MKQLSETVRIRGNRYAADLHRLGRGTAPEFRIAHIRPQETPPQVERVGAVRSRQTQPAFNPLGAQRLFASVGIGRQPVVVVVGIELQRHAELLEVRHAGDPVGARLGCRKRLQHQPRQNSEDGNHRQQFGQGERATTTTNGHE